MIKYIVLWSCLYSQRSIQQSYTGYYTTIIYYTVPECCPGYSGASPDCQGSHATECMLFMLEYLLHFLLLISVYNYVIDYTCMYACS